MFAAMKRAILLTLVFGLLLTLLPAAAWADPPTNDVAVESISVDVADGTTDQAVCQSADVLEPIRFSLSESVPPPDQSEPERPPAFKDHGGRPPERVRRLVNTEKKGTQFVGFELWEFRLCSPFRKIR